MNKIHLYIAVCVLLGMAGALSMINLKIQVLALDTHILAQYVVTTCGR